jgi:hypothetical protein
MSRKFERLERDPEYDTNRGDFTNQLAQALFEKPGLSRAEAELKKKEQEGKTQKYDGLKKRDGTVLTCTVNQVPEILSSVCAHFGVDTHPLCDKCHMRHNPAGGCVKAELVMKAFELSGPLVKAVPQTELTAKQSVIKDEEKEIRSSDIKLLESLVRELHTLDSTLNKVYQRAGPVRRHPNGKAKIEYATVVTKVTEEDMTGVFTLETSGTTQLDESAPSIHHQRKTDGTS